MERQNQTAAKHKIRLETTEAKVNTFSAHLTEVFTPPEEEEAGIQLLEA